MHKLPTSISHDEWLWRAWQYIADELDDAQREEFERLLGESQAAREAVAEAVELRQLLVAAGSEQVQPVSRSELPDHRSRRPWAPRTLWLVTGAAAGLLVATGLRPMLPRPPAPTPPRTLAATPGQARLALAWSETRARLQSGSEAGQTLVGFPAGDAQTSPDDLADLGSAPLDPLSGISTPDWIRAAVRAEAELRDMDDPEESEDS
ncbi:MAG: hypothetical protein J5I93_27745 [Pirellulaceae bacterium]|nr:hypothetical protein [Pirellulaceae bacterium]